MWLLSPFPRITLWIFEIVFCSLLIWKLRRTRSLFNRLPINWRKCTYREGTIECKQSEDQLMLSACIKLQAGRKRIVFILVTFGGSSWSFSLISGLLAFEFSIISLHKNTNLLIICSCYQFYIKIVLNQCEKFKCVRIEIYLQKPHICLMSN